MKTIIGTVQFRLAIMQLLLDKSPDKKIVLVNGTGALNISIPQKVELIAADARSKSAMKAIAGRSELIFSCTKIPYDQWAD